MFAHRHFVRAEICSWDADVKASEFTYAALTAPLRQDPRCAHILASHPWVCEPFFVSPATMFDGNQDRSVAYGSVLVDVGECVEDVWVVAYLLRTLSAMRSDLFIFVRDDDGELPLDETLFDPTDSVFDAPKRRLVVHRGTVLVLPALEELPASATPAVREAVALQREEASEVPAVLQGTLPSRTVGITLPSAARMMRALLSSSRKDSAGRPSPPFVRSRLSSSFTKRCQAAVDNIASGMRTIIVAVPPRVAQLLRFAPVVVTAESLRTLRAHRPKELSDASARRGWEEWSPFTATTTQPLSAEADGPKARPVRGELERVAVTVRAFLHAQLHLTPVPVKDKCGEDEALRRGLKLCFGAWRLSRAKPGLVADMEHEAHSYARSGVERMVVPKSYQGMASAEFVDQLELSSFSKRKEAEETFQSMMTEMQEEALKDLEGEEEDDDDSAHDNESGSTEGSEDEDDIGEDQIDELKAQLHEMERVLGGMASGAMAAASADVDGDGDDSGEEGGQQWMDEFLRGAPLSGIMH